VSGSSTWVYEAGVGTLELWPLSPTPPVLERLLRFLFEEHWQEITFGPLIQGSAWELRSVARPRLFLHDGYLTVDFEPSHFHLCIGPHCGDPGAPTPAALAAERRTSRAELFRRINRDGTPDTWGGRLFNGAQEQQITVLFPNPFVSDGNRFLDPPDWSRLKLWNDVRRMFLGLPEDASDRAGRRMIYP